MSTRPVLKPYQVIVSGSMAADITGDPTIMMMLPYVSYTLVWTGSPVGNFSVEVSNDYSIDAQGETDNPGTWVPITFDLAGTPVSVVPAGGAAGTGFFDIHGCAAYAIRLVYDATSGVGTLNAFVNGKVT